MQRLPHQVHDLKHRLMLMRDPDKSSLGAEFAKHPIACLTLASYLPSNTGDVARKYIRDPELLSFIDIECYCWSTVLAEHTPMINAGMVGETCLVSDAPLSCLHPIACDERLNRPHTACKAESMPGGAQKCCLRFCFAAMLELVFRGGRAWTRYDCLPQVFCDRHYGGINYPRGGVGRIAELLVEGLQERGSYIEYKANVSLPLSSTAVLAGKLFLCRGTDSSTQSGFTSRGHMYVVCSPWVPGLHCDSLYSSSIPRGTCRCIEG